MDAQAAFAVKLPTATASRKVMYMLYGAALAIGVALIVHSHREYREALLQQAMARSAGVTGTLSAQMNGARITRLMEKYDSRGMLIRSTQDAWYYVEHGTLRKSAQAAGLELPLTAVAYDRLKQELQVVVTSADKPALRDTYAGPGTAEIQRFLGHGDAPPLRFTTGDEVITVDAVRDPAGKITGALVARTPMATLESAARAGLLRDVAIAALIYALVGALLFRRVGRLVRKQETDHRDLQERHEDITHSISYAEKIQSALVPSADKYGELFDDFFVLNRPRDVVSGDFHWYHRLDEHIGLVAAADCTGHGVPGAMMAAIACSLLNDLGREMGDRDPATLLAELNRRMVRNLHQDDARDERPALPPVSEEAEQREYSRDEDADGETDDLHNERSLRERLRHPDENAVHKQRYRQADDEITVSAELEYERIDHRERGDPIEIVGAVFHAARQFRDHRLPVLRLHGAVGQGSLSGLGSGFERLCHG